MPMLDQFQPFMHDFIDKIVDVKGDGNCGYRSVAGLLGMSQDSWSMVRNYLLKELVNFSEDYIKFFEFLVYCFHYVLDAHLGLR